MHFYCKLRHVNDRDVNDFEFSLVAIIRSDGDWWWAKNTRTQNSGFIPSNYVVIDDDRIESQE